MDRRLFLGLTATAGPLLLSSAECSQGEEPVIGTQTDDGIFIENVPKLAVQGFPSENAPIRSVDLHSTNDERRRWALQHITEVCKTQTISRGSGQVTTLPRNMQKLDHLKVRNGEGHSRLDEFLRDTSTDAFLVLRKGKIITEKYFNGMRPDTPHLIWSCSKSISAGVVANLLETEAKFTRDSPVTKYIPGLKDRAYDDCTIDHLLNMQSCVEYRFGNNEKDILRHTSDNECGRHYRSAEMYPRIEGDNFAGQYAFIQSMERNDELAPHGSFFCYKDSDTAVLSWVCEKLMKTRFVDLISELVWSRLGAEHDASIICGPQGFCTTAAGISVTLRDFARWGQMHLQMGNWNGHQIVPKEFIENVSNYRKPLDFADASFPPKDMLLDGTTYHDQFWINVEHKDAFHALGHCGQVCYIHPPTETVIVRFASAEELNPKYNEVFKAFGDIVGTPF